ncbi:MAG: hypothetical protein QOE73_529 [Verrucomicrobiota bacterium]
MMLSDMLLSLPSGERIGIVRTEVETDENALDVGEVADDLADRRGQFPYERWYGQNLIALRELRIFQQIDNLDVVAASEVVFADLLEIAKGGDRFGSQPGHVKQQVPIRRRGGGWFRLTGCG